MHQDSILKAIEDVRITKHEYTPDGSNQVIPYRRVTLVFMVNGVQSFMHFRASKEQLGLLDIVNATKNDNVNMFDQN